MPFVNPPAMVAQLQVQLLACAAWTYGSSRIHYPEVTGLAGLTYPLAILAEDERRIVPFCEGASPLITGRLLCILQSTDDIGTFETFAQAILFQLVQQQTGIPFNTSDCGMSTDPAPGKVAGGLSMRTITLHLPYGLQP